MTNIPKIHDFGATFEDGNTPSGRLIKDAAGNLYGVTTYGGLTAPPPNDELGHGVIFRLSPEAETGAYHYDILHRFAGGPTEGARPFGGLLLDGAGHLYGTTAGGGSSGTGSGGTGTVFKLTPAIGGGWALTTLYQFTPGSGDPLINQDGASPRNQLVMDAAGRLFGTTNAGGSNGGGTVFALTPQADGNYSFENLHNFAPPQSYNDLTGGLTMDASGNLYGLRATGGTGGAGELFALFKDELGTNYIYKSLYSFAPVQGDPVLPLGDLALDSAGNLFGTTSQGGINYSGSVFKYSLATATLTTLYSFNGENQGWSPVAGVILDAAGNLFGTTEYSTPGNGAIYKLIKNDDGTYTYASVFEFTESKRQGSCPESSLLADSRGHLFGTTNEGGLYLGGVAFKIGETAEAMAVMEGGVVLQIMVTKPGSGYTAPPVVTITPPTNGSTAEAVATISNGSVTAVSVTNAGSGYDFGPQVIFSSPHC